MLSLLVAFADGPPFDLETWMADRFPSARQDAFEHVNNLVLPPLSVVLVCWPGAAFALVVLHRYKQLVALVLGPVMAVTMVAPFEDWADPNWFIVGAATVIGCFVGLTVTVAWCLHFYLAGR